MLSNSHVNRG